MAHRLQRGYREQMVRIVSFVLAAAFGLCAGVLMASGATVAVQGQTLHCSGPIVSMEIDDATLPPATNAADQALRQACERKDDQYLLLAGLAGLLCLAASTVATGSRRPEGAASERVAALSDVR